MSVEAEPAPILPDSAAPVPPQRFPTRLARWAQFLIPRVVGVLFIIAGVQKAIDPTRIVRVLEFDGLPHAAAVVGTHVVWVGEVVLGGLLIAGAWPRRVMAVTIGVLFVFSAQLAYLVFAQHPPDCACITLWEKYTSARQRAVNGLIRNAVMAVALEWTRLRVLRAAQAAAPTAGAPPDAETGRPDAAGDVGPSQS